MFEMLKFKEITREGKMQKNGGKLGVSSSRLDHTIAKWVSNNWQGFSTLYFDGALCLPNFAKKI